MRLGGGAGRDSQTREKPSDNGIGDKGSAPLDARFTPSIHRSCFEQTEGRVPLQAARDYMKEPSRELFLAKGPLGPALGPRRLRHRCHGNAGLRGFRYTRHARRESGARGRRAAELDGVHANQSRLAPPSPAAVRGDRGQARPGAAGPARTTISMRTSRPAPASALPHPGPGVPVARPSVKRVVLRNVHALHFAPCTWMLGARRLRH